jgi:sugar phosphate isomerase/epimerase
MKRRAFVQSFGAAAAGVALSRRELVTELLAAKRLTRVGLELYSVRNAMKADPERTLAAVRAIGYMDVELLWSFDNFARTPEQVRATLAKEGLRAPSAHISPSAIRADWQKSIDTAKLLGHTYLIVPSLPASVKTLDGWREWADAFNTAGAAARRGGIWLAFHNEPDHMKPIDGKIPYDVFIQRLDPSVVRLQLDVGNMLMGGGDPMKYLQQHRNRYWSFHLKDVVADRKSDTELGTGTVNFKRLLSAIPNLSAKPCYVEQEAAKDELASARTDFNYLHTLTF